MKDKTKTKGIPMVIAKNQLLAFESETSIGIKTKQATKAKIAEIRTFFLILISLL